LQHEIAQADLDVDVIHSGCLEVCKLGPVVFYSGDKTWYTRVTPDLVPQIVQEHLKQGHKIESNLYPAVQHS
jgi:(2Fe-2S) ferredoxin